MTTPRPSLGRLQLVPPREVWKHEAQDFTPWLLANADVLSDLLGMHLDLEVAEHRVGDFSLDLLGRDTMTGQKVIVENQLEVSDHTHLGQILTYAAGTDPTTIVWVAPAFRPEHRAALDWLNTRTDEHTRFFGVEIAVVRIGDSEAAPMFKLIAQPNDWEKSVRAATTAVEGLSDKEQLQQRFWEHFMQVLQRDRPSWSRASRPPRGSWFSMSTGSRGADPGRGLPVVRRTDPCREQVPDRHQRRCRTLPDYRCLLSQLAAHPLGGGPVAVDGASAALACRSRRRDRR